MPLSIERVQEWRRRAEELRAAAAHLGDPDARSGLLKAAESYDKMADELQQKLDGIDPTPT
jgi:hypothetical protein